MNLTTDTIADVRYPTENSTSVCSWNSSTSVLNQNNVGFVVNSKLLCFSGVISVGLVGSCANAVVLGAFLLKKQESKTINKLIVNQIALDLFASVSLVVSYSTKLYENFFVYLDSAGSAILCKFIANGVFPVWGLTGSSIGLVMITLERYFKIVHSFGYRKYFCGWMIHAGIALSWMTGFLLEIVGTWTTGVKNGKCYKFFFLVDTVGCDGVFNRVDGPPVFSAPGGVLLRVRRDPESCGSPTGCTTSIGGSECHRDWKYS